jgi:hypothetical protein
MNRVKGSRHVPFPPDLLLRRRVRARIGKSREGGGRGVQADF